MHALISSSSAHWFSLVEASGSIFYALNWQLTFPSYECALFTVPGCVRYVTSGLPREDAGPKTDFSFTASLAWALLQV